MSEYRKLLLVTADHAIRMHMAHLDDVAIDLYTPEQAWDAWEQRMKRGGDWHVLAYGDDVSCPMAPDIVVTGFEAGEPCAGRDIRLAQWVAPILRLPWHLSQLADMCERKPAHAK